MVYILRWLWVYTWVYIMVMQTTPLPFVLRLRDVSARSSKKKERENTELFIGPRLRVTLPHNFPYYASPFHSKTRRVTKRTCKGLLESLYFYR